jgi:hypothetical protein
VSGERDSGRDETKAERLDRNLQELLGELRVILPGVQVLFAFLLVAPFNQRFADLSSFQRDLYLATLLLSAAAAGCLMAPTIHHRITFRTQDKDHLIYRANQLTIAGCALLALSMTGAIWLITGFLFEDALTTAAVLGVGVFFAVLWYGVPLRRLRRQR